MSSAPQLPPSATQAAVGWSGVAAMAIGVAVLTVWSPFKDIAHLALLVMACTAIGVFVPDLLWQRIYRRALVAPNPAAARAWPRVFTKFAGLLGSVGFVAQLYWLFPEYRGQPSFYVHYWAAVAVVLPVWAVLALPYLYWVDRRLAQPEDSLWQLGRLVTCRWRGLSARVLGQHLLGWTAALLCYQPFWSQINNLYFAYDPDRAWGVWLSGTPWLYGLWGALILVLVAIYLWSTVAFGGRFSNLTHRGIITNGPYRYSKHPAYLAKNLSWWLIAMPFMVNTTIAEALRHSALLLLLNGIYYLRAKTEERHLALDPVYRQYAQWIDAHGVLRFLNRLPGIDVLARWRPTFRAYESPAVF